MSTSTPTRARAFGLRIVSPDGEQWVWFARLLEMARDLALRLHAATHRLGHHANVGFRVPFTMVDEDGIRLTWLRKTPYQAGHTRFGATWRIRTQWTTYEVFNCNGHPLQIQKVLRAFDLEEHLGINKKWCSEHADRGRGPVPRIHKSRGGPGWFRGIQTSQEIRLNELVLVNEGEIHVRSARNKSNLPTAWEDFWRTTQRNWKEQRKARKQWDRRG
jgi:hypothetical protein